MANKTQKYIMRISEIDEIYKALIKHKKIKIIGLGIFYLKKYKKVTKYSPGIGGYIISNARERIKFRPSATLKNNVY